MKRGSSRPSSCSAVRDFKSLPPRKKRLTWLKRKPLDPRIILPPFLLTVAALEVHMAEEYLAGFGPAISRLFDASWTERSFLMIFAFIGPALYALTAIGLYFFFVRLKATGSILAMALGHTVLALPVVVIIMAATLQGFDVRFEQAALSLGASRLTALRRVTLPLIMPGVLSAALFAFLTSFDELLIPLFLSGVEVQTLTVRVWNSLLLEVDPTIAAVSSFLIAVTIAVLGASALLQGRGETPGT